MNENRGGRGVFIIIAAVAIMIILLWQCPKYDAAKKAENEARKITGQAIAASIDSAEKDLADVEKKLAELKSQKVELNLLNLFTREEVTSTQWKEIRDRKKVLAKIDFQKNMGELRQEKMSIDAKLEGYKKDKVYIWYAKKYQKKE